MKRLFLAIVLFQYSISAFSAGESSDSASFYLNRAKELNKARKVWEADRNFQKALQFKADDDIRLAYADYLVEQRKYFPAVEQVGKVLENNNNHRVALEKMTDISFVLSRWSDVVMYGNKLLQSGKFKNADYMLGKSFYELENYGLSQKFLRIAITNNPADLLSTNLLAKVYVELKNYKEAIALYSQSLQVNPNDHNLTYDLGMLNYIINNEKEAVKYFELAAEKGYKTDLQFTQTLGYAYLSFDLKKGVEVLNKVLEMKPGNYEILFQIAQAQYQAGKYNDAAEGYKEIYDNDNSRIRALYMAGISLQKKGDKNKGVALCEQAIRMDPSLAQLKSAKLMF